VLIRGMGTVPGGPLWAPGSSSSEMGLSAADGVDERRLAGIGGGEAIFPCEERGIQSIIWLAVFVVATMLSAPRFLMACSTYWFG